MKPTYDELIKMVLPLIDDQDLFEWGLLKTPKTIPDIVLECSGEDCGEDGEMNEWCFFDPGLQCDCVKAWIEEREE